jgi:uncharacterized alpha-E superfamily protein
MLSRVANTLYWMARYVERADNLARLIDVNRHLLLDNETLGSDRIADFWRPIILCTGDEELFQSLYPETYGEDVIRFLTDDPRNVSSIVSCIAQARESARTVRDQLSDEMWEEINALHLFVRSDEAAHLLLEAPPRYYKRIRRSVATFLGISATTHPRDEGWEFMELGRHLERADKTTRFLDTTSYLPQNDQGGIGAPGMLHWTAILGSCGALGAFRAAHHRFDVEGALSFLVFSRNFPRSVRYCADRVDECIHLISGSPRGGFLNEAERVSGRLLADLNYGNADEALALGLHPYLDGLQERFNRIGELIFETFVLMPEMFESQRSMQQRGHDALTAWQEQQQQQQQ